MVFSFLCFVVVVAFIGHETEDEDDEEVHPSYIVCVFCFAIVVSVKRLICRNSEQTPL